MRIRVRMDGGDLEIPPGIKVYVCQICLDCFIIYSDDYRGKRNYNCRLCGRRLSCDPKWVERVLIIRTLAVGEPSTPGRRDN